MAQGRLWQDAFFLFLISVASIYVAVRYNWRNSPLGYWLNLFIVSIEDLLFIFLIVVPGYVPFKMIFTGPLLWVIALACTTIAYVGRKKVRSWREMQNGMNFVFASCTKHRAIRNFLQ